MTLFCSVLAIAIPLSQLGCIMVDDSLFMVYLTSLQYLQDICHATHRMIFNFKTSLASTRFFSHYYFPKSVRPFRTYSPEIISMSACGKNRQGPGHSGAFALSLRPDSHGLPPAVRYQRSTANITFVDSDAILGISLSAAPRSEYRDAPALTSGLGHWPHGED
jgi:hypothetical protein